MTHVTRVSSMAMVLIGTMLLSGCSSSTEPRSDESAQGYALRIVASPTSPAVGDTISVTFTIENATSNTLSRTFADLWTKPQTLVVSGADLFAPGNGFGDGFGDFQAIKTLVLEPHQVVTGVSTLVAARPGEAELTGCLPADVTTGADAICVDAFVTVRDR